jgi:parallel beta-helix repeat protein
MKNVMRCTLLAFSIIFSAHAQTSYYVSNAGNDNNNGRSVNSAFQSLSKINSLNLQAGDRVLFRRGDTFTGSLTIRQSGTTSNNIIVDAYGTGNKPILSGSVSISNWINIGGNIWQATCTACGNTVTGFYKNGFPLPLGRFPNIDSSNKGYLTVQSHIGKTQLTSQQALSTNWINAEVVVRPNQYILDRANITQQNGNTLTLNNNSIYNIADGFGFFIQNHPSTLDQNGEWYYNPSTKNISLYHTLNNPNSQSFRATVQPGVIIMSNVSNITIQNLRLAESLNTTLSLSTVSNFTVKNIEIINAGEDAIGIYGFGNNILFENNIVYSANNNAIDIIDYSNAIFRNNTIKNIGVFAGRGKSGDGQYRGISSYSTKGVSIENNIVDSIGYSGITFLSNTIIQRNTISNFCLTKSDGGGLYTVNESNVPTNNMKVLSNIIYNGIGALAGQPASLGGAANGINLDDCTQNVEVSNNTVFNCNGLGIYLHATTGVIVSNNISYNNTEQFVLYHNFGRCPARNNTIQNNIFAGKSVTQGVARYESVDSDLASYGSFDNNYYVRPFDDAIKILVGYKNGANQVSSYLSLPEWQRLLGKDVNSKNSPILYKGFTTTGVIGQKKLDNMFNSGVDGWYATSYYNNGQTSWDNSGRINGGTLRVDFPTPSNQPGSYAFAYNGIGAISKGKNYIFQFDATASMANKAIQVFIRQRNAPYTDLDVRYSFLIGTTPKHYEVAFTSSIDENDAIIMIRVSEEGQGQSVWFDNLTFQEATIIRNNPDNLIKLLYNNTQKDTTIILESNYRDVKNQLYNGQIVIAPFSSVLLFKETEFPDLTPIISLPSANFTITGSDATKNFTVKIFEISGLNAYGNILINITAPLGYTLNYNNNITTIDVSGGSVVTVDNTKWKSNVNNGIQLILTINNGEYIPANSNATLGFTITRNYANSNSTSNLSVNVNDDSYKTYDSNNTNNIYVRSLNAL